MKINKKVVSKRTYVISNIIYHSLCLSGLVWQVTNISINFFRFEVIKDINVILPEELKNQNLILNICFENDEILDRKLYDIMFEMKRKKDLRGYELKLKDRLIKKYLAKFSFADRFAITPNASDFIQAGLFNNAEGIIEFIFGNRYCYQMDSDLEVILQSKYLNEVSAISLMRGQKIPHFDHWRLVTISNLGDRKKAINFRVSSFMYSLKREKWPYQENCMDYVKTRIRPNAIADCVNDKIRSIGKVHKTTIVLQTYIYKNFSIADQSANQIVDQCDRLHIHPECNQTIYMTEIEGPKIDKTSEESSITFSSGEDDDLSFIIVSRARIDNIDYVTYVLGALGAWIGFSFIAINPVSFLMTTDETAIAPASDRGSSTNIRLYREFIKSKRIIHYHHQLFKSAKSDRDQLHVENQDLKCKLDALATNMTIKIEGLYQYLQKNRHMKGRNRKL